MKVLRAFLSHSSTQKDFVEAVARELGRQYCVFDQYSFHTGDDLHEAIKRGLNDSSLFVLFASKEALKSFWVDFELNEASRLTIQKFIERVAVFIVDTDVAVADLPSWLQKAVVTRASVPKLVAREIRDQLDALLRAEQQSAFVGRSREVAAAEKALFPADGSAAPRVLALWGLSGIGRRTLSGRLGRDLLNLKRPLVFQVQSGDSVQDIATKVATRLQAHNTPNELQATVARLAAADTQTALKEILSYLEAAITASELPVFVDAGGLLDNDGRYSIVVSEIIRGVSQAQSLYATLITERRPTEEVENGFTVPHIRVDQLTNDEVKRLLAAISVRLGPALDGAQATELADYIGGYPPAAHYAMQLARDYGLTLILAEKARLVDFRARAFVRYLSQSLKLGNEQRQILSLLATYNPLPLPVIGRVLRLTPEQCALQLAYLIDASLIRPDEGGLYWLVGPIVEAVHRLFGRDTVDHTGVASELDSYLNAADPRDRAIELAQALFRAKRLSGVAGVSAWEVGFASDLIQLTRQSYHARDYDSAIKYGRQVTAVRPDDVDARDYLIRALIQDERYEEAEQENQRLRDLGAIRDHYFLAGFLERRRGRPEAAIKSYSEALNRGRRGVAIHRELAQCYVGIGETGKAAHHIDLAQQAEFDNRFVVDLKIQIAVARHDDQTARQQLEVLKVVDEPAHYEHRRSTVELASGDLQAALSSSRRALGAQTGKPPFQMMSQLIKCLIESRELTEAQTELQRLSGMYPRTKQDIQHGLKCKWEIASGNYENALAEWAKLRNKSLPVHKALRVEALKGLIRGNLPMARREEILEEVKQLELELQGQNDWRHSSVD